MRARSAGTVGPARDPPRHARTRGGRVRLPPNDGAGPTTGACSSPARVPAHRDLRGASTRLAHHRAERPTGAPDDRAYRVPHDRAPNLLTPGTISPPGPKPFDGSCRRY